jgi:hypothetical protein
MLGLDAIFHARLFNRSRCRCCGGNGLNVSLDGPLVANIKSIASTVKGAVPGAAAKQITRPDVRGAGTP